MLPPRITQVFHPTHPPLNTPLPSQHIETTAKAAMKSAPSSQYHALTLWLCYSQCPSHPLTRHSCDNGVRPRQRDRARERSSGGSYSSPRQALVVSAGHSLNFKHLIASSALPSIATEHPALAEALSLQKFPPYSSQLPDKPPALCCRSTPREEPGENPFEPHRTGCPRPESIQPASTSLTRFAGFPWTSPPCRPRPARC